MIPKKPVPHSMRGGYRFSEKIIRQQEAAKRGLPSFCRGPQLK
jgi:hypothetical protein